MGIEKESVDLISRFYNFYGYKNKLHIAFLFIGAVVSGIIELLGLILLYILIRVLIDLKDADQSKWIISFFQSIGIENTDYIIPIFAALILSVFLIKNIYIIFYYTLQHKILRKWKNGISNYLMENYLYSPYSFLLGYDSATVIRNVNSTAASALNGFILSALNYGANIITGLVMLSLLYLKYLGLTLVIGGVLVLATILQNKYLKKRQVELGKTTEELAAEQTRSVYQGLHAVKETKVVGKEKYFLNSFKDINSRAIDNELKSMFFTRLPSHITEIVIILAVIIITVYVLLQNPQNASVSVSSLGVLGAIAFRLAPIMNRTIAALQTMNRSSYSMKLLFSEIDKLEDLKIIKAPSDTKIMPFDKHIAFKDVSFSYPGTSKLVLNKVNFKINKGEFIGVVGASGAGKTTLIDLLLGLLSPTQGDIEIDNTKITPENVRSWQMNLGYVPQAVYMGNTSIAENVAFGVTSKEVDNTLLEKTLREVQLLDFVKSKKGGTNFVVGENGKNLSGGQKQRLGIARALYLQSQVLILDEATSSLDVPTESEITKAINGIRGRKTIIVIAHRLSTIFEADKILFMDDGKLIDTGTYKELFERNESFNKLGKMARITPQ